MRMKCEGIIVEKGWLLYYGDWESIEDSFSHVKHYRKVSGLEDNTECYHVTEYGLEGKEIRAILEWVLEHPHDGSCKTWAKLMKENNLEKLKKLAKGCLVRGYGVEPRGNKKCKKGIVEVKSEAKPKGTEVKVKTEEGKTGGTEVKVKTEGGKPEGEAVVEKPEGSADGGKLSEGKLVENKPTETKPKKVLARIERTDYDEDMKLIVPLPENGTDTEENADEEETTELDGIDKVIVDEDLDISSL